jgi:microsomal dipeptidase-like Zn-dependent dipeptidase
VSGAAAQTPSNLDFEEGLRGWTASGEAFAGQPLEVAADQSRFPASPLGGDYWKLIAYPLGHHGRFVVSTDDAAVGSLVSDAFVLGADDRYFSILIGGADARGRQRVELQVDDPGGKPFIAWQAPAPGIDLLQQRVFAVPPAFAGRRARIVLVDDSRDGHLTVDYARLTAAPPQSERGPVWGIADYHAHPMSHLAFGALRGVHTLWGRPGRTASSYADDPSLVELDLPQCSNDHHGGNTAGIFINTVEKRVLPQDLRPRGFVAKVRALLRLVTGGFTRHPDEGAPQFSYYPGFLSGAHQQMHVTQIHRAWQGGLRLMVAVAVHNEGVEYLASPPGDAPPTPEREVLDAQVCGMRRLAALNAEWMQIAYTPEEARDIIHAGKLAVVLGVEFDRLGELAGFAAMDDEIQYLWDLGVRQVTPIHGIDNRLGGAAVFEPAYNMLNDLLKRGPLNLGPTELDRWEPVFFDVRNGGCTAGPLAGVRGECVLFKFSPTQDRPMLARTLFSPFSRTPTLGQAQVPRYREHSGHMNTRGLTAEGRSYISSLLSRGMLVGLEHMSRQSVEDLYRLIAERLTASGRSECATFGAADTSPACADGASPLFISHAHFRALAIQDRRRTTAEGFLPDEFDIGDRELEAVRRTSGVTGVFLYENPIDEHPLVRAPFANDCAASSKTFAYGLLYGLMRMGGAGVGLATDFTFVPATVPRFGENACWGLKEHWDARPGGPLADQYHPERQENGVRYDGIQPANGVRAGTNAPLRPYMMGRRTYDFNVDGLAHYGMLPDLLQDLRNIGLGEREFGALFSSAEAYITMWEKATRLSAGDRGATPFTPLELPCERLCKGLCP